MAKGPRMNKDPEFLAAKLRRVHDPHVRPRGPATWPHATFRACSIPRMDSAC